MRERELPGVQKMALEAAAPAIDRIAGERVAEVLEVDADLVRAAGLRPALDEVQAVAGREHAVVRHRLTAFAGEVDGHFLAVRPVAADCGVDGAAAASQRALDDGEVDLFDRAVGELPRERLVRGVVLRNRETAAGFLVQPVHDARPLHAADAGEVLAMVQQSLHERAGGIARAGVHDEAGGLVHHEQVGVFVQDRERDVLRLHFGLRRGRGNVHRDLVAFPQRLRAAGGGAVAPDLAGFDQGLHARAREFRHAGREEAVEPIAGFFGGDVVGEKHEVFGHCCRGDRDVTLLGMSEAIPEIVESCPSCGQPINVTGQEPFTSVLCPKCGATMRARLHFNNFTLLELLGEGGMGSVFKAVDNNLQRKVALKILKRSAGSTQEEWVKLAAEAKLTAAINHQNVVKVFSFGEDHGQFYLAMELVEKGSLDSLMVLQTRVAEAQVLDIGIQIAEGLQAAYEGGLIHRDIKPGNILFATPRLAKIVDFGLARVLADEAQEQGEIWGTPFYVAPEKLDGRPEDFRSDIYSLGGTLFHALAGRPPFDAKTASMVVLKHIKSQVVSLQAFAPQVSDETAYVINRMMAKEPDDRYPSYEELLTHLHYARQKLAKRSAAQGGNTAQKKAKAGSNRPMLAAIWSVAALLCAATLAWAFVLRGPAAASPGVPEKAWTQILEGRQALAALQLAEARGKFAAAVAAAGDRQPMRNWALAQLGLANLLLADTARTRDAFTQLGEGALFDLAPAPQAIGRFFQDLSRRLLAPPPQAAPNYDGATCEAFGLLATGLHDWASGDVEQGGELLERFARAHPAGPDAWIAQLKPVADPYLAEYRRYRTLRDAAKSTPPSAGAELLVRIDQARSEPATTPQMRARLDALSKTVRVE